MKFEGLLTACVCLPLHAGLTERLIVDDESRVYRRRPVLAWPWSQADQFAEVEQAADKPLTFAGWSGMHACTDQRLSVERAAFMKPDQRPSSVKA